MVSRFLLPSFFLIMLSVAVISAQEPYSSPSGQSPSADSQTQGLAAKTTEVMGTISKVDAAQNSLTLKRADKQEESFTVEPSAKITVDGKAASIAELKAGQKVTVTADSNKATSISATSSGS